MPPATPSSPEHDSGSAMDMDLDNIPTMDNIAMDLDQSAAVNDPPISGVY